MKLAVSGFLIALTLAPAALAGGAPSSLAGSEWGFPGDDGGRAPFVQFGSEGRVSGFGGCNRFTGTFVQNGAELRIGPLAATRMACPEDVMKLEMKLFGLLDSTRRASATHLELVLMDEAGATIATLARRDAD